MKQIGTEGDARPHNGHAQNIPLELTIGHFWLLLARIVVLANERLRILFRILPILAFLVELVVWHGFDSVKFANLGDYLSNVLKFPAHVKIFWGLGHHSHAINKADEGE